MKIANSLWRWWKFVCVALVTTFIVLLLAATVINHVKKPDADRPNAEACLDQGGTWDADAAECRTMG